MHRFGLGLPRALWAFQAGNALNAFGTGLVLPFVIIWLHDVRGISLGAAGAVLASFGALSLAVTPLGGTLLDKLGSRAVLIAALVVLGTAYSVLPFCRSAWQAAAVLAVAGIGNGAFHPASSAALVALTPEKRRHTSFSLSRAGGNLGLGLGSALGGVLAAANVGGTPFTWLFLADAATFGIFALVVLRLRIAHATSTRDTAGSWRAVLADRPFLVLVGFNAIIATVGYAQLEAALPAFARDKAGVAESVVGLVFAANVAAVVVLQIPISRLLEGKRRMRALALCTAIWGGAWLLAGSAGLGVGGATVALLLIAGGTVGIAECLHGAISGPLTADLAPAHLRGRYLSLSVGAWGLGFSLGPALAGAMLGFHPLALWPLLAGACFVTSCGALMLERRLPEAVRRTPAPAR
jgi:MFS family permease